MAKRTYYILDTLTAPEFSGFGAPEQRWQATYLTQHDGEAALHALADNPAIMAAALVKWESGTIPPLHDLDTGSWGSRNTMGGTPTETLLIRGDRSFVFADGGWYALPDWRETRPNERLPLNYRLQARPTSGDTVRVIKAHPHVCRRDFLRNLHLLEQRPVFPGA